MRLNADLNTTLQRSINDATKTGNGTGKISRNMRAASASNFMSRRNSRQASLMDEKTKLVQQLKELQHVKEMVRAGASFGIAKTVDMKTAHLGLEHKGRRCKQHKKYWCACEEVNYIPESLVQSDKLGNNRCNCREANEPSVKEAANNLKEWRRKFRKEGYTCPGNDEAKKGEEQGADQ